MARSPFYVVFAVPIQLLVCSQYHGFQSLKTGTLDNLAKQKKMTLNQLKAVPKQKKQMPQKRKMRINQLINGAGIKRFLSSSLLMMSRWEVRRPLANFSCGTRSSRQIWTGYFLLSFVQLKNDEDTFNKCSSQALINSCKWSPSVSGPQMHHHLLEWCPSF